MLVENKRHSCRIKGKLYALKKILVVLWELQSCIVAPLLAYGEKNNTCGGMFEHEYIGIKWHILFTLSNVKGATVRSNGFWLKDLNLYHSSQSYRKVNLTSSMKRYFVIPALHFMFKIWETQKGSCSALGYRINNLYFDAVCTVHHIAVCK